MQGEDSSWIRWYIKCNIRRDGLGVNCPRAGGASFSFSIATPNSPRFSLVSSGSKPHRKGRREKTRKGRKGKWQWPILRFSCLRAFVVILLGEIPELKTLPLRHKGRNGSCVFVITFIVARAIPIIGPVRTHHCNQRYQRSLCAPFALSAVCLFLNKSPIGTRKFVTAGQRTILDSNNSSRVLNTGSFFVYFHPV